MMARYGTTVVCGNPQAVVCTRVVGREVAQTVAICEVAICGSW